VQEQPEPTEEEHERAPERVPEEDAKSAAGHDDPEQVEAENRA
jgi:hypothetical protein